LNSSYSLLPDFDYLKLKKIIYHKLSKPQSLVTRFGVLSLKSEQIPSETPHQNGPTVVFQETFIACKNWVFNEEGSLEGFLEISLDPLSFKATLPLGTALSFTSLNAHDLLQDDPFPIYGKVPDAFWEYAIQQRAHYAVFLLFMLICLVAMTLTSYWIWWRIKNAYKERVQNLTSALCIAQTNEEKTEKALVAHQQRAQSHQSSCQSYKKLYMSFRHHQRELIGHLLRFLNVLLHLYKRPNAELHSKDQMKIVESCIKVAEHLCDGTASKIKNESIKVLDILDNIQELFIEKIHKSNLDVETNCSENLLYDGDPFLMEFILINVIGKPLHSVPPNRKVSIKATNQKEGLQIQVKDNGYVFDKKIQKQINQAFDFFIPQEIFRKLCQDNNLLYEHHRAKNGFNIAKIFFPKPDEQFLEDNIIPFFRRTEE
jgi:hypothetical protein